MSLCFSCVFGATLPWLLLLLLTLPPSPSTHRCAYGQQVPAPALDGEQVRKLAEKYALLAAVRFPNAKNLDITRKVFEELIVKYPKLYAAKAAASDAASADKSVSPEAEAVAQSLAAGHDKPAHIVASSSAHKNAKRTARLAPAGDTGGNGNYRHCETSREVAQLSVDKFPDLALLHPFVQLNLDEAHGKLRFEVELPYIAFDARYVLSFEPIEHAHLTPLECSSDYNRALPDLSLASYEQLWGHAPNANHHDAFTSAQQYGAYYRPPDNKWTARAAGCSHLVYSGEFSVDDLLQCRDSAESFSFGTSAVGEKHRVAVLSGSLHVSVLKPLPADEVWGDEDSVRARSPSRVAATWTHPFLVMIDENDSKVALVDSANGGLRRRVDHSRFDVAAVGEDEDEDEDEAIETESDTDETEQPDLSETSLSSSSDRWHERALQRVETVVRSVGVDSRGQLELLLQTAIFDKPRADDRHHHVHPRNMTLAKIIKHQHKAPFELAQGESTEGELDPYCIDSEDGAHMLTLQNWRLVSTEQMVAYDGDFTLLFCDASLVGSGGGGDECDESVAMHRTALSVRVSNPKPLHSNDIVFHSEITQHHDLQDDKRPHAGAFESGDRVCMQTYVIGPKDLTQQMEVELLGAWLCANSDVTPDTAGEKSLQCGTRKHSIQLVGQNDTVTQSLPAHQLLNVTVHHPGLYGLLSVAVCFDTDARFTDARGRSIIETHQRYESHVRMGSATLRRAGATHIEPLYDSVLQSVDKSHVDAQHTRKYDEFVSQKLAHVESQSLQRHAFAPSSFQHALRKLRAEGATFEQHGHEFQVAPRVEDLHLVTDGEATAAVVIVIVVIIGVFVCALMVMWRRRNRAASALVGARCTSMH